MSALLIIPFGLAMAYAIGWAGDKLWPPCHCEAFYISEDCPDCGRDPLDGFI